MRSALGLMVLLALTACRVERPLDELARDGVELRTVEESVSISEQSQLLLVPGDFVFTGRGVRAVVGGMRRKPAQRGVLLELQAEESERHREQAGLHFTSVLYVGGVARTISVRRMFILERHRTPTLRIEGAVTTGEGSLLVAREIALGRVAGTVSISVRVQAIAHAQHDELRVGARVEWGGASPFVAGLGVVEDENFHRADWVAAEADTATAAVAFAASAQSVRATYEGRVGQRLPVHTDIVEEQGFGIEKGQSVHRKLGIVVGQHGIGEVVRRIGLWRGRPFRESWAYLPHRPRGARVEVRGEENKLVLTASPDAQGRAVLPHVHPLGQRPLPLEATATAYGHAPSDVHTLRDGEPPFVLLIPRGGSLRLRVYDGRDLSLMPARARLLPAGQQAALNLGPDHRSDGAGDTVITLRGEATVPVPPGRYRVLVTHGPEWSLHEAEVRVTETYSPLVRAELLPQVEAGAYVACDLHVHSALSPDSQVSLRDRLASLAAEGVQFAVPTDHNHVSDYLPTAKQLGLTEFNTVSGVEITTWDPAIGHFNAYPYPRDAEKPGAGAPEHTHVEPRVLFDALHKLDPDMVVQINHPRLEGGIGYFDVMRLDPHSGAADPRYSAAFDAIEVFNGFDLARPDQVNAIFRDWLQLLARGQRVVATGSSDSHQVRYQLAGYPRTYASVPEFLRDDPREIVRAVKRGASFISSGPFLEVAVDRAGPGDQATLSDGKVALSIRVRAPDWMPVDRLEVYMGTLLVHQAAIPNSPLPGGKAPPVERYKATVPLMASQDTFVVVRVQSSATIEHFFGRAGVVPMAFTNPIFLDADGDGRTPWSLGN